MTLDALKRTQDIIPKGFRIREQRTRAFKQLGPVLQPFNSQKWLGCNFSLKYPYIILHTGNKNTQTNQAEVVILIQHQILANNLQAKGEN